MPEDTQPLVSVVAKRFNGKVIRFIISLTQAEYTSLPVKDEDTLYFIVG